VSVSADRATQLAQQQALRSQWVTTVLWKNLDMGRWIVSKPSALLIMTRSLMMAAKILICTMKWSCLRCVRCVLNALLRECLLSAHAERCLRHNEGYLFASKVHEYLC